MKKPNQLSKNKLVLKSEQIMTLDRQDLAHVQGGFTETRLVTRCVLCQDPR